MIGRDAISFKCHMADRHGRRAVGPGRSEMDDRSIVRTNTPIRATERMAGERPRSARRPPTGSAEARTALMTFCQDGEAGSARRSSTDATGIWAARRGIRVGGSARFASGGVRGGGWLGGPQPRRAGSAWARRTCMRVGDDLPRLRFLLWNRGSVEVSEGEAFALYEGNRQWVDRATMGERERRLFDRLVATYGRGISSTSSTSRKSGSSVLTSRASAASRRGRTSSVGWTRERAPSW